MSRRNETEEYIDSVNGHAHQSAVEIIDRLRQENKAMREDAERLCVLVIKHVERNSTDWDEACNIAAKIEARGND